MYKVYNWFLEMGISVCDWLPYSPDLNPIEHVWKRLKELVLEMHPELSKVTGEEDIRDALEKALREAWNTIPESFFNSLIESIENRVKAVIKTKGLAYKILNINRIFTFQN
jgi:hypothetical protein